MNPNFDKSKPIKICTFGDSLTQGNPPPNHGHPGKYQYFMLKVLAQEGYIIDEWNFGIGGQIMGEIARRIPDGLPTDILVISGGTNDCWRWSNLGEEISADMRADVLEQMEFAIDQTLNGPNGKDIKIILCSIPPIYPTSAAPKNAAINVKKLCPEIKKLAKRKGVYFCDIFSAMADENGFARKDLVIADGVHFTHKGNKVFGETLANCILKIIKNVQKKKNN
ncbi:MAG: SGNH/GDSL hydrolase family protein [Promethearchaeota archaeon]